MNRLIRYTLSGCMGAIIGWICLEPWHDSFSSFRDFLLLYAVSLGITIAIIIEKFFFAKKSIPTIIEWIKDVLKNKYLYLIPLIGVIFVKSMIVLFTPNDQQLAKNEMKIRFLILDVSESMCKDPLKELKRSVTKYMEMHRDAQSDDQIGCIVFSTDSKLLFSPHNDYNKMITAINGLTCKGTTNMEPALSLAFELLNSNQKEIKKEMILLSDGIPNNRRKVLRVISDYTDISIHTIGVGKHYDKRLLNQIASSTKGQFFPADNIGQLSGVFKQIAIQNLTQTTITHKHVYVLPFGLRLPGWAVYGLLIGLTIGIVNNRKEMIWIASTGGFIGGAFSSIIFVGLDYINFSSGALTRFMSFSVLGCCIGLTIYIVDYVYSRLIRIDGHLDMSKLKNRHSSLQRRI